MKNLFWWIIQKFIYVLGIILVIWLIDKIYVSIIINHTWPSIEKLANWAQIIIAYMAVFAVGQYALAYSERADRKTKTVLELVKFFRENVIKSADGVKERSRKEKIPIPYILLRKNSKIPNFTEREFFMNTIANQKDLVEKYTEITKKDFSFEEAIRSCLNAAEEFSIAILNSDSQDHEAIASIRKPYVEIIEQFAIPLYYYIGVMNDKFSYTSRLYKHWKEQVGFIPRDADDIKDRYEERKKSYSTNK